VTAAELPTTNGAAVLAITAEDLARIPGAGAAPPEASGAAAARAAAGNPDATGNPSSSEPSAEPSSSSSEERPPASAGSVVLLVDTLLALGVQLAAHRCKVPFRDVAALARLSKDERELLEQFAPSAAPFLGEAANAAPIVGALAFAGLSVVFVAGRFRDVRAMAPTPSPRLIPPPL